MKISANRVVFKSEDCIELVADNYLAIIAPKIGSSVIRFRDTINNMEIFRYNENDSIDVIKNTPEIWGLPNLYLPNRLAKGVLRTSDATYQLPINEKALGNFIHGFLHKREHSIDSITMTDNSAIAVTSYLYDESDDFFVYFPITFKVVFTYELSHNGLSLTVGFKNLSSVMMPISFASHTTINSPFVDGGFEKNICLNMPVEKRLELDEFCLPTEKYLELSRSDIEYKDGTKIPVLKDISNEMFTIRENKLKNELFNGIYMTDTESGKTIVYEVDEKFKFFILWNDNGDKGYFCPEPMSAMINAANLSLPFSESGYTELNPQEEISFNQRFYTTIL